MTENKNRNRKLVVGGTALVLALGMGMAAIGTSSAYFSETAGTAGVSQVVVEEGSIDVTTDAPTLDYSNLLPGEEVTKEFAVTNTGENAQDLYITFTDPAALAELNAALEHSSMWIEVNGEQVFTSDSDEGAAALPSEVLLQDGLAAGETVTVTVGFMVDAGYTAQTPGENPITLPYSIVATQPGIAPGA